MGIVAAENLDSKQTWNPFNAAYVLITSSQVMSSMRPWAHESKLHQFFDVQRSISRTRTPSTPSYGNANSIGMAPDEAVRRVDEMRNALHNLKACLAQWPEMAEYVGNILEYLRELRAELPIPSPHPAFTRLQPLRDMIFWLPPVVLRGGQSDLPALIMLAHLYATALVVEGLFPEIVPSYLGVMCLPPLERIRDILQMRQPAKPADPDSQTAMQIIEYPTRVLNNYKSRQRHHSASALTDPYGRSTHSPHHLGSLVSGTSGGSPGEQGPGTALFGGSPVGTPANMSVSMPGSYFAAASAVGGGHRSGSPGGMSVPGIGERSASMSLVYGNGGEAQQLRQQRSHSSQQPQQIHSSHDVSSSRLDYFPAVLPSSPGMGGYHHQQSNLHHQQHHSRGPPHGGYYTGPGGGGIGTLGSSAVHSALSHNNRFVAPSQLYA